MIKKNKKWMKNSFIMLLLILLCIFSLSAFVVGDNITPVVDKKLYYVDDSIKINVNVEDINEFELFIVYGDNEYRYLGQLTEQIVFKPVVTGDYVVYLSNKEKHLIVDTMEFTVVNRSGKDAISMEKEYISTDKIVYQIGESVGINFNAGYNINYRIVIIHNDKFYEHLGAAGVSLKFIPKRIGDYKVNLEIDGITLSTTGFSVVPKPGIMLKIPSQLPLGLGRVFEKELDFTVKDSKNKSSIAIVSVTDDTGGRVEHLVEDVRYNFEVEFSEQPVKKIKFSNLLAKSDLKIKVDTVDVSKVKPHGKNSVKAFAIDPTALDFDNAIVSGIASGSVLYKCRDWDFDNQLCLGTWEKLMDLKPGQPYSFELTPDDPGYAEVGLATVNTNKSMYHINETAEVIMVVLDNQGFLVNDAYVELTITNPADRSWFYSTRQNTIGQHFKGIYAVNFSFTDIEGEYDMFVRATGTDVDNNMSSFFIVKQFYEFDILRQTPVTIDPWKGPFSSNITIVSFLPISKFDFIEVLPVNFTITKASGATQVLANGSRFLIWKNLKNNSVVSYSAQAPLVTPDLYELGPARVIYGSSMFLEARTWYLAIDPATDDEFAANQSLVYNGSNIIVWGNYSMTSAETSFSVYIQEDDMQLTTSTCSSGADFECVSSTVIAETCKGSITGGSTDCSWDIDDCKNRQTFRLQWTIKACSGNETIPSVNRLSTGGSPAGSVSFDLYYDVTIDKLDEDPPVITVDEVGEDDGAPWATIDQTPQVNITLDEIGDCRMSDSDETYDNMADNTDCTGDGTIDIICIWDGTPLVMSSTDWLFVACNDTSQNKHDASTNTDIEIQILCDAHSDCPVNQYCHNTQACDNDVENGVSCSGVAYGGGNDDEVCGGAADTGKCASDASYISTGYYCTADADDCVYNDAGNTYDLNYRLCNAPANDYKSCGSSNTWESWQYCADQWDGNDTSATASTHTGYNCSYHTIDQTCSSGDQDGGDYGCSGSSADCGAYIYFEDIGCGSVLADCDVGCGASCDVDNSTTPAIVSDVCYYDKSCSSACAWSQSSEGAPEFCINDWDGGACVYSTRTDPTNAETCYWNRECLDTIGANLSSSSALRADFCDYCNVAGNQNGDASPAPTAPCASGCANSGTIYYDSGSTYADRSDDCSVGSTTILSDTLQTGDVWDGNNPASCDDTECDNDCGLLTGTCVGGPGGTCTCSDDDYPTIKLEQPYNDTWSDLAKVFFYYNVSDYGSEIENCTLIINGTINKTMWNVTEDLTVDFNQTFINGSYTWQVNCTDNSTSFNENSSELRYFGVDTTLPQLSNPNIDNTTFNVNELICMNITVTDTYSGIDIVVANVILPDNPPVNVTLLDSETTVCDSQNGDGVFSIEYILEYSGGYNWTRAYVNDSANNLNKLEVGLNWSVSAAGNLSVALIEPVTDIEVNESREINYTFNMNCSAQCEQGVLNCTNVSIHAQYYNSIWIDLTTTTLPLVNWEDAYNCGNLTIEGPACNHTFNITTGTDSGNNIYPVRCEANSENSPTTNSSSIDVTVNEYPVANFTYPQNGTWLRGVLILNGSNSTDVDGSIVNYLFEIDDDPNFDTSTILCNSADHNCTLNTTEQTQCADNAMGCFLRLNVTDNDGLKNETVIEVGIDNTGPSSTLDKPPSYENITNATYVVNATVTDSGIGNISVVTFLYRENDAAAWNTACTDNDGQEPFNCTWDIGGLGLLDGISYQILVYANDTLANVGNNDTHTNITIDRNPPNIKLEFPPDGNWSVINVTFIYNVSDLASEIRNCSLIINNKINETMIDVTQDQSHLFNKSFEDGAYNWYINCTDYLGNENTTEVRSFNIDNTGPVSTLDKPVNFGNISGSVFTVNATVVDSGIENISVVTFLYRENDATSWSFACNDSDTQIPFNCSWDVSTLVDGDSYQVRVWANDTLNNIGGNDTHTNITIDNNGPNILLISPDPGAEDSDGNIFFYYSVTDLGSAITNCSLYFNNTLNDTNFGPIVEDQTYSFNVTNLTNGGYFWNISCFDDFTTPYQNTSETRSIIVNIQYVMNVSVFTDKQVYEVGDQLGEIVNTTTNVTDINDEPLDVDVNTDIIKGNTTVSWWNVSWKRRQPIYVNELEGTARTDVNVRVYVGNLNGNISSCQNEIRVINNATNNEMTVNIVGGDDSTYCDIIFLGNVSANAVNENNYYVYYNNTGAPDPGYPTLSIIQETLFFDDFADVGLTGWTQDAQNDWVRGTTYSYPGGTGAAEVDGGTTNSWLMPTDYFNMSIYDEVNLSYAWYIETRWIASDYIRLEYTNNSGGSWNEIDSIVGDGEEGVWVTEVWPLAADYFRDGFNFRYNAVVDHPQSDGDVDYVNLTAWRFSGFNLSATTGNEQIWIASGTAASGLDGLWSWLHRMTNESTGNYSEVSVGSKALYPDTSNSNYFELIQDQTPPNVTLFSPLNLAEVNASVTFTYIVNDTLSSIYNCTLYVDGQYEANDTIIEEGIPQAFYPRIPTPGWHNWTVNCTDIYGNEGASEQWSVWVKPPDLAINVTGINFSTYAPVEGENITIFATIFNLGGSDAFNITVQFWIGDWENGTMIDENRTILNISDVNGDYSNRTVNVSWPASIGPHNIYVVVDPPLATNGSIFEMSELNNYANITYYVPSWHIYYGNASGKISLSTFDNESEITWNITSGGNIFVIESGTAVSWTSLLAIGINISNLTATNDFAEMDTAMNMTDSNDSVYILYTVGGIPMLRRKFVVYGFNITNVSIVNSTNNSNFVTGILWDYSDENNGEYNGTQDLVFITNTNTQAQGKYGVYDYEIRVPARLREYKEAVYNTVDFYVELK